MTDETTVPPALAVAQSASEASAVPLPKDGPAPTAPSSKDVEEPDTRSEQDVREEAFAAWALISQSRNRAAGLIVTDLVKALQSSDQVFVPATNWYEYTEQAKEAGENASIIRFLEGDPAIEEHDPFRDLSTLDNKSAKLVGRMFLGSLVDQKPDARLAYTSVAKYGIDIFGAMGIMAFVSALVVRMYREESSTGTLRDEDKPSFQLVARIFNQMPGGEKVTAEDIAEIVAWGTPRYYLAFDEVEGVTGKDDVFTVVVKMLIAIRNYIENNGLPLIDRSSKKSIKKFRSGLTKLISNVADNLYTGVMALLANSSFSDRYVLMSHMIVLDVLRAHVGYAYEAADSAVISTPEGATLMRNAVGSINRGIQILADQYKTRDEIKIRMSKRMMSKALAWASPEWGRSNAIAVGGRLYLDIYTKREYALLDAARTMIGNDSRIAELIPGERELSHSLRGEVHTGLDRALASRQVDIIPEFLQQFLYLEYRVTEDANGEKTMETQYVDHAVRGERLDAFMSRHRAMLGGAPWETPAPAEVEPGTMASRIRVGVQTALKFAAEEEERKAAESAGSSSAAAGSDSDDSSLGSDSDSDDSEGDEVDEKKEEPEPLMSFSVYADDRPWLMRGEPEEAQHAGFFPAEGGISRSGRFRVQTAVVVPTGDDETTLPPVLLYADQVFGGNCIVYAATLRHLVDVVKAGRNSTLQITHSENSYDAIAGGQIEVVAGHVSLMDRRMPVEEVVDHLRPVNGTSGLVPRGVYDRAMGARTADSVMVYVKVQYWDNGRLETAASGTLLSSAELYQLKPVPTSEITEEERKKFEEEEAAKAAAGSDSDADSEASEAGSDADTAPADVSAEWTDARGFLDAESDDDEPEQAEVE